MKDYKIYILGWREKLICILLTLGITGAVSWLFYRSIYGVLGAIPLLFFIKRLVKSYFHKKQQNEMLYEFGEMLQLTAGALKAGYSMENAFIQALQEYTDLYGTKTATAEEFCNIVHQMKLNMPLEQLMEDLAQRSGIEEMISFAQVFSFSKRGGGDMMKVFENTTEKIRQKAEVEREIETVMAAKRTEQRIMELVPFGILLYVGATSPEFLEPLYGNWLGAFVMTICLLGYAGAFLLAEKILNIQV